MADTSREPMDLDALAILDARLSAMQQMVRAERAIMAFSRERKLQIIHDECAKDRRLLDEVIKRLLWLQTDFVNIDD
jgi:phosphopantothenate synthetase